MKSALEILIDQTDSFQESSRLRYDVLDAMKEYARQCCEQVLKEAAENARQCIQYRYNDRMEVIGTDLIISKDSIINTEIKTP